MEPSSKRPPLPTPPPLPNRLPYPNSYGPSSTIKPQKPVGSQSPPQNAHAAFPYPNASGPPPNEWIPYASPTIGRGSTFFVGGSGTQLYAPKRPPLPTPPPQKSPSPTANAPLPPFTSRTAYSPPHSPQRLPPGAMPSRSPPQQTTATTKVPLSTTSSIMVHSGFWNILSATGSRFYGAAPAFPATLGEEDFDGEYLGLGDGQQGGGQQGGRAALATDRRGVTSPALAGEVARKKRISIDMIGRPGNFSHLCHASDAEQAEDILRRWSKDGVGKLAQPAWVQPIKEAARARARARAVAEVQANRDVGSLKVVNGLPSSLSVSATSAEAVEDGGDLGALVEEEELLSPVFPGLERSGTAESVLDKGTTRAPAKGRTPLDLDGLGGVAFDEPFQEVGDSGNDFGSPRNFVPSLTTIEKAVATKVFFETHYHGLLKKPRDRDQRKDLLEKELSRLNISDAERRNVRAAWALSETEYLRDLRTRVNVGSFSKLKVIGHGAFGVVSLVKERGTGELYAMKQLRKADMLRKGQEGHVRAERDLLATAATSTRWTVRLAYSFQDVDCLYLVMSFMSGGDLLTLLIEKDVFEESFAKFYISEMVLAVEETHKVLGAIHRDIKPDNFLFDKNGHIAISDYGLATDFHWAHDGQYYEQQRRELLHKHGIDLEDGNHAPATTRFDQDTMRGSDEAPGSILTWRDKNRRKLAYSVVGTNNYMSVEVLRGKGYDQACDWWSLGVIMFEMLYGYPPFVSKSRQITRSKIINWRTSLRFPPRPRISREAQDLITNLICEREDRLGSRGPVSVSRPNSVLVGQRQSGFLAAGGNDNGMQHGAEAIKAHPWFRGIDFETIHLQTPPFVPQLSAPGDTRYFEDEIDDNPLPPPDAGPGGPAPDATRDPMLRDKVQGAHLLDVRKQLAFQGWTYKKPRNQVYDPRRGIVLRKNPRVDEARGRSAMRSEGGSGFGRSLSV